MASDSTSPSGSVSADLSALMRIRNLELRARNVVEAYSKGIHRSSRHGFSTEFVEYRSYVPGDDIRHLDWKVLARRDKSFIRKFQEESNLRCHLLLDLSRSMSYGSLSYSKLDYARTLAATLAMFLHGQNEEIGLLLYDEKPRDYIPPRNRSGHLHSILAALSQPADGAGAALQTPIDAILNRSRMRGLIIVITDCLTPLSELEAPLSALATSGHDVTLFQTLDPTEIHFDFKDAVNFEDIESGTVLPTDPESARAGYLKKFNAHQDGLTSLCDKLGILHHLLPTDQPLEHALQRYLSERQARGPIIQRSLRK